MVRISVMSQSQWNWFHLIPRTFIFEPFLDLGSLLDPILDHTSPLKDLLVPKSLLTSQQARDRPADLSSIS
jgi:hypothetical protein